MVQKPLNLGFLSSLTKISFPNGVGLIWVMRGVPPATGTIKGGQIGYIPVSLFSGQIGKATGLFYGGSPLSILNNTEIMNFVAVKLPASAAKTPVVYTLSFPTSGFLFVAAAVFQQLSFSSIYMSEALTHAIYLYFEGGEFYGATPGTPITYVGNNVLSFSQNFVPFPNQNTVTVSFTLNNALVSQNGQ